MILKKAENTMAYFKCGIFGFQGSGKTFTATDIAMGLCSEVGIKDIVFFDTETGSDFMLKKLKANGFEVYQVKSRSFGDLLEAIKEAESGNMFLIIDSLTHVWRDLMTSYDKKLQRNGRLQFQDWAILKGEWQIYTDLFVNSRLHIIACGRAGYDYDYDINEDGTKDLVKTNTKFKAEGEFGFEPSLVIEMQRLTENIIDIEKIDSKTKKGRDKKRTFQPKVGSQSIHRMHILKDRTDTLNGMKFDYYKGALTTPFNDLKPHFNELNIGGTHLGYDTERTSEDRFNKEGKPQWMVDKEVKEILLEKIKAQYDLYFPSTTAKEKQAKIRLAEMVFKTNSWKEIEKRDANILRSGLDRLLGIVSNPENIEALLSGEIDKIVEVPKEDIPDFLEEVN